MNTAKILVLVAVALLTAGHLHSQTPALTNTANAGATGAASGAASADLTDLVSGSRWTWWEGNYDRFEKGKMKYWVEFYKDGTARVPWRDHAQYWKLSAPNVLTLTDSGLKPDKQVFVMDLAKKSGSREDQNLHIRYEKKASKPARFK